MSLLDENQSVIGIIGRRRQLSLSASSSASSLKLLGSTKSLDQENPLLAAHRASGAIPKKPLPAIVEPHDNQPNQKTIERERKKIGKAKSVTSDTAVIKDKVIIRQSSVPVTSEKTCFPLKSPVKIPGSPLTTGNKLPVSDPTGSRHLSPRGPSPSTSETSGIQAKGSHESLAESTGSDSGGCHLSGRKSISPVSPSRSDTGEPSNVSTGNVTKKQQPPHQLVSSNTLPKKLSHVLKTREGSLEDQPLPTSKQDSFDLPTLDEESTGSGGSGGPGSNPINPVVQRRPLRKQIVGRDDSIESNAKYSDTSSLLSHRFSTISISSNVSSSDMSISASGGQSGSSCYLASMSSTDFDDRPILASSISLSEAEIEPATPATAVEVDGVANTASAMFGATSGQPRTGSRKVKLKAAYKRPLLQHQRTESSTLPSTTEEESGSPRTTLDGGPTAAFARSRIGTETSLETSIENPTCIQGY